MIYVLVGAGGSGKSSLQKYLVENKGYQNGISCTTRPIRQGEIDGIDYHFLSEEEFLNRDKNNELVCVENFRGWYYGLGKDELKKDNLVLVLTPDGVEELKTQLDDTDKLIIIYVDVDYDSYLNKMLETRDDKKECNRRALSDKDKFEGYKQKADITLINHHYEYSVEQLGEKLDNCLKAMFRN